MHYINYLLVIALVFVVCKLICNKKAGLSTAIEPCKVCGAAGKLNEDFFESHVSCTNPFCAMAGPKGCCEIGAIDLWNNLPSMTTVVAWQFQAAGAALALQKIINAKSDVDACSRACYWACPQHHIDALHAARERFDAAVADARKVLELHS